MEDLDLKPRAMYSKSMNENQPNAVEAEAEHVPTLEEVSLVFVKLAGEGYKEVLKREDEKGLYLLEIEIPSESEGEVIRYEYMRKRTYPEGGSIAAEIHVAYYDAGIP